MYHMCQFTLAVKSSKLKPLETLGKAWSGAISLLFALLVISKTQQELNPEPPLSLCNPGARVLLKYTTSVV